MAKDNLKLPDFEHVSGETPTVRWDEENKIGYLKIPVIITEDEMEQLVKQIFPLLRQASGKGKIYVDLSITQPHLVRAGKMRKRILGVLQEVTEIGVEKIAMLIGSIIVKTALSFIIAAGGLKNIKIFKTQEEALNWLKESE
ncbi:MAG: STAS/SEC14 domain-containing protein [Elusimicrobiota bacterium]